MVHTEMGTQFFLIKGGEVTESVSEKVVTALLKYIQRIRKQLFQ